MPNHTAGIVVIGDEILKGLTKDTNSFFISKKLWSMGIKLKKISVIPDEVDTIATEIYEFSKKYDLVITSGGIGPTHDDVTYEGVAKAFGEKLKMHKEMSKYVHMFYPGGKTISDNPSLKMANLPKSAKILHFKRNKKTSQDITDFPIVQVFNVVLFPGIPQLLECSFSQMEINDLFPNAFSSLAPTPKFHKYKLYYRADEVGLVETLNRAVALFRKNVNIGCYPVFGKCYNTLIVIDSVDELLAVRARAYLKSEMQHGEEVPPPQEENSPDQSEVNVEFSVVAREVSERVFSLLEHSDTPKSLLEPLAKAIKIVGDCFSKYDPGTGIFISFNGGKDCTVLLHLIFAFYTKHYPQGPLLRALYIQSKDPFPELEDFVQEAALRYNIQLQIQPGSLKEALQKFIKQNESMKAVFIGTRRTDPKSVSLQPFQMTDGDWPRIMRVSPLLDWSYENVWTFLHLLSVPYCSLYDEGSEVLNYAAELTSNLAEVLKPAFGPDGLGVLFAQRSSSSANSTGMTPLISRTGLEMVEILALRNEANTVHPLLKSLVDSCRLLELEWGDGVKSLVLITSELLRQCAMLECDRRPGWLRRELGKAMDLLSKSCDFPDSSHLLLPTHPSDSKQHQEKCSNLGDKEFSVNTIKSVTLMNANSSFITNHYREVCDLLETFFYTRFPMHVVEVVPKLLCEWVKGMEKDGRNLDFVIDNFSSLCHVNVGFPVGHCSVVHGIIVQGCGIGHLFTSDKGNFHKETCPYSLHEYNVDTYKSPIDMDKCHGCVNIKVEIITDHEISSAFSVGQDHFEFKTNYLYLTSCIPSDFIKFKICQLKNVSLIHSIPEGDVDFFHYLMYNQISSHMISDCFCVNWIRKWPANPSNNSGLFWLGVPNERSLILCVPVLGMKDGLKRSCYNSLSLVRQFSFHCRHRCTENFKSFPLPSSQDTSTSSTDEPLLCHLNKNKDQNAIQKGMSSTDSENVLPLTVTLCSEKLFSSHIKLSDLENMVAVGGLAEIYLHDMVRAWWLMPARTGGEPIDRGVTKAIALAILAVPVSLSTKGKLNRKLHQPLTFTFSSKSKELFTHRLRVMHLAVSVVFSLSNISNVMLISKCTSNMSIKSRKKQSDSDDSD